VVKSTLLLLRTIGTKPVSREKSHAELGGEKDMSSPCHTAVNLDFADVAKSFPILSPL
jgi:hypothetical protein